MNNKIEELDAQIAELTAKRDALLKGGKRWRGNAFDKYWVIDDLGFVGSLSDERDRYDDARYSIGNYFRTEAEAQHALKRIIATQQLKDRIAEMNAEQGWAFDSAETKYYAAWHKDGYAFSYMCKSNDVSVPKEFYGDHDAIEVVMNEMPEQIKLWLGVE